MHSRPTTGLAPRSPSSCASHTGSILLAVRSHPLLPIAPSFCCPRHPFPGGKRDKSTSIAMAVASLEYGWLYETMERRRRKYINKKVPYFFCFTLRAFAKLWRIVPVLWLRGNPAAQVGGGDSCCLCDVCKVPTRILVPNYIIKGKRGRWIQCSSSDPQEKEDS